MQETVLNGESMNIVEDNIEKLKSIFPDVFTEGKVDFEKLQDVLGNYIEKKEERYNFTWNGKSAALRLAQTPSTGTLRPCKEDSKNWDTTKNLYIEGDNLEVLKLLQKSYHNKIKMIYIDPPYNTGGDFVYPDNFKDNIENYKKVTGQIDDDGNLISTNSESDGRYHTNWLNMMYPRLRLARNLLSDNGVIFISIDDNENDNLRKICDEIFGEQNRVCQMIWQSKSGGAHDERYIVKETEYVLVYAKNKEKLNLAKKIIIDEKYNLEDEYVERRGKYILNKLDRRMTSNHYTESLNYPITMPDKSLLWPGGGITRSDQGWNWRWGKDKLEWGLKNGFITFKNNNGNWAVYSKQYENVDNNDNIIERSLPYRNLILSSEFSNTQASNEIIELFGYKIFEYAKSTKFINHLVTIANLKDNDILMDFFSGSASSAHAILQKALDENINVRYIMVQLPEIIDNPDYKNICEIGKERIKRVCRKIEKVVENANTQLKINETPKKAPDVGFKVFKLDTSNIKKWNGNADTIESEIQGSIFNYEVGRSELDVVYEVMLKCGLDLTYPIEEINVNGKTLYSVGAGAMFVCMDDNITQDIADKIVEIKDANDIIEPVAVFKDNGFTTDSNKTNIKETLRVAAIKDFITV